MADGKIVIDTSLDNSGIKDGLSKMGSLVTSGAKAATGAIGAVIGYSVKVGSSFESSMSQVAATMGMTAEEVRNGSDEFKLLEKAAKDAGATTQFSASESAEALNYLALAGYDAEKAASALPTVLNLAAAGGLDLAYASDLATDAMSALGLETDQLGNFTDKLAKTAQKSNTSVGQLGEAILTVGGTAKILAGGTTELNTALGILADNGIKGSEGGTALRNVILSLTAPTDKAADKMKALGLKVLDANGNMRPLNDIFKDLNKTLGNMSDGKKTEVLNSIFNKVDLKSVNALLANSGERFDELSGYIDDADGAAANMARTMNDNLKGKIEIMKSALETLGNEIYDTLKVELKGAVDDATANIDRLTKAFKEGGFEGLLEEISNIMWEGIEIINENLPLYLDKGFEIVGKLIEGIAEKAPDMATAAMTTLGVFLDKCTEKLPDLITKGIEAIANFIQGISDKIPELIPKAIECVTTLAENITANTQPLFEAGGSLVVALGKGIVNSIPELVKSAPKIIFNLITGLLSFKHEMTNAGIDLMISIREGLLNAIPELLSAGKDAIWSLLTEMLGFGEWTEWLDVGWNIVKGVIKGILNAGPWAFSQVGSFFSDILSKAKESMGINSPSKVMRDEVGKWMAQGVGVGFTRETDNVSNQMNRKLAETVDNMRASVGVNMTGAYAKSAYSTAGTNAVNTGGNTIINNFNMPVESPYETYKATRKAGRELGFA